MKTPLDRAALADSDPFSEENLANPGPYHAALRDAGGAVRLEKYGIYALSRYEIVRPVLSDWQNFESGSGVGLRNTRKDAGPVKMAPGLLLQADPPYHDAPRHVLEPILSPRALRALQITWKARAEELVDRLMLEREVDAVRDIAQAFPLRVFPDAVGLTQQEGRENLLPFADHLFNLFGPVNALVERGSASFPDRVRWVDEHCAREALSPGGFGARIWDAADLGDLTADEAPLVVRATLAAGIDTTVHGLGALLYGFMSAPDQYARLQREPDRVRVAFDEAIRWESPVQTFFRTTTSDVDIDGTVVAAGEKVLMFLGAANSDPRRWDDPDRFDIGRDPSGHVGFGMGIHQCVGQHVARLEAECVVEALLARVDRLERAGEPVRHLNNTLRGWGSLPVRLVPKNTRTV